MGYKLGIPAPSHAAFDEQNSGKTQKVNFSPPETQVPPKPCSLGREPLATPTPRRGGVLIFNHWPPVECRWGLRASPPTDTHEDPRNLTRGAARTPRAGFQPAPLSPPSPGKFYHDGKVGILNPPTWEDGKSFLCALAPRRLFRDRDLMGLHPRPTPGAAGTPCGMSGATP